MAKVDAVTKANIANINDLTIPAGLPSPTAAYSMRLLSDYVSYSGPAMRIRRSGDDIEADVEFDTNNEISLTSPISNASSGTYTDLADFVDHTGTPRDAFVDEWKDQSGNAYHAAQGTATSQPKLYDATTGLITENGKSAMDFDGGDVLEYDWPQVGSQLWGEDMSWFTTCAPDAGGFGVVTVQDQSTISVRLSQYHGTSSPYYILILAASGNLFLTSSTTLTTGQRLLGLNSVFTSTTDRDFTSYLNGAQVATGNHTGSYADNAGPPVFDKLRIGVQYTQYFNGRMQEVLMYSGDVTTDRADIENNINGHFSIYT